MSPQMSRDAIPSSTAFLRQSHPHFSAFTCARTGVMNVSSERFTGGTIMKTQETTTTTTAKKPAKTKATKGVGKPAARETAAKTPKATKTAKAKHKGKDATRAGSKT